MQTNKFLGAILLIAGTSTGAAMLALPVSTAAYGFFPSILLFAFCWACMTMTGLLLLEVNLWLKPGSNIVSMAKETLGVSGKMIAWLIYALLFYSLMAAYVSGMGNLIQTTAMNNFHWKISTGTGSLLLIFFVGTAVYFGARSVDYLNRFFFFAKAITFFAVVLFVAPYVEISNITHVSFKGMWLALPIVITSFGFQNTIPSLRVYLEDDVKKLRLAILIGSCVPLLLYIIWEFIIVGAIPIQGDEGLLKILVTGQPATGLALGLDHILHNGWISNLFRAFTLFAIATSFIGVSFSLFDYLIDSFQIKRNIKGRLFTLLLAFVPPLIFAYTYPDGFILALGYAGIFVAILLGILPVLMSWSGRYYKKIAHGYQPKINRFCMVLLILFSIVIIFGQLKING